MTDRDWIPVLKALADETRLRIVRALLAENLSVNEIAEQLRVSQYNISKHLRVLREAGIIEVQKKGTRRECALASAFQKRLAGDKNVLDLGCCSFRFDALPK
jgi:DNA-binding transcriptional ArsR family regulator